MCWLYSYIIIYVQNRVQLLHGYVIHLTRGMVDPRVGWKKKSGSPCLSGSQAWFLIHTSSRGCVASKDGLAWHCLQMLSASLGAGLPQRKIA